MPQDKKEKNLKDLFDVAMNEMHEEFSPLFSSLDSMTARYTEHELVATGGMKKIYKVLDNASDRYVALARLHEDAAKEQYDSFIREARLTGKLEHPNIMDIYDLGILDGEPYFTMELKNGGSLDEILQDKAQGKEAALEKFNQGKLLGIFLKICDAVSYAHSKNVLHLDLKPANIQVGDFGEVLVCDWGLGKVVNDTDNVETDVLLFNPDLLNHMTLNGHVKGTPGYMAPEQIGGSKEKSFQTDIYSLGAILYSLLTDEIPFEGSTEKKIEKTLSGDLKLPSERFPDKNIPAGLEAVVLKAMKCNPQERYGSVVQLRKDVLQYISGYAPMAEEAGLLKQLKLFWHRNLLVCLLCSLFFLVMTLGLVTFISQLQKSRDHAENQRLIAVENQKRSEETLRLYEKEKEQLLVTQRQWSTDITLNTEPLRYHFFFESPNRYVKQTIEGLTRALKINPENERAIGLLGHQYFMTQRFHRANEIFVRSYHRQEDIYPISQEFANLKDDDELLTVEQLTELIRKVGKNFNRRHHLSERLLAWHVFKCKKEMNYIEPVKALISILNSGRGDFSLEYDLQEKSLVVTGASLSSFAEDTKIGSGKCLLRFLALKSLIFKEVKLLNAADLAGLNQLEVLDVSHVKLKSAVKLRNLPKLKRLIIARNQLSRSVRESFEGHCEIIIVD